MITRRARASAVSCRRGTLHLLFTVQGDVGLSSLRIVVGRLSVRQCVDEAAESTSAVSLAQINNFIWTLLILTLSC